MEEPELYCSVAEAAQQLGKSTRTVRRWIQSGRLPALLVNGPHGEEYRVRVQDLDLAREELANPTVPATAAPSPEQFARALADVMQPFVERLDRIEASLASRPELPAGHDQPAEELQEMRAQLERIELAVTSAPPPEPRPWWRRLFS